MFRFNNSKNVCSLFTIILLYQSIIKKEPLQIYTTFQFCKFFRKESRHNPINRAQNAGKDRHRRQLLDTFS